MTNQIIKLIQGKNGIELPFESGNWVLLKEEGYSPIQMLLASVAGCGAYVYQSILNKSNISYTFKTVSVKYTRNQEKQSKPIESIDMTFEVKVADEDQERARRALKLISKNCPVIQSLDSAISVSETIKFI
ncbi:OsmC family protein [Vagococcus teuberi]|uniref:Peroxiredoxin n=1 Tax=Vagococcus teuberi TaxID=519472 RepID=A0A1J0A743_9ENTE|nr:OsmC family protein [Vagococcus teuberi]APB31760.1 peroxiredoxin [Vagococcus teuberi]